jgi:hypothetical protein
MNDFTRWLWKTPDVLESIRYVLEEPGELRRFSLRISSDSAIRSLTVAAQQSRGSAKPRRPHFGVVHTLRGVWVMVLALAAATLMNAASMRIYTEFRRIDPFGNVVGPDQGGSPREVISPAVGRNAFASFLIAVEAKAGSTYELHLGQIQCVSFELFFYRVIF